MNFKNFFTLYTENSQHFFTCGYCAEFAASLHNFTGWDIGVFKEIEKEDDDEYYSLIHAFLYTPDGRIADVRGIRNREQVIDNLLYGDQTDATSDLSRLSEERISIEDLENEQGFGFNEAAIEKAEKFIIKNKKLWNI